MYCRIESIRLSQVIVAMERAALTECYTILHSPASPLPVVVGLPSASGLADSTRSIASVLPYPFFDKYSIT